MPLVDQRQPGRRPILTQVFIGENGQPEPGSGQRDQRHGVAGLEHDVQFEAAFAQRRFAGGGSGSPGRGSGPAAPAAPR